MQQVTLMAPDCSRFIIINDPLLYMELRVNYGTVQMVGRSILCKSQLFWRIMVYVLRNETVVTKTVFLLPSFSCFLSFLVFFTLSLSPACCFSLYSLFFP
jgi:hypothetical protein